VGEKGEEREKVWSAHRPFGSKKPRRIARTGGKVEEGEARKGGLGEWFSLFFISSPD